MSEGQSETWPTVRLLECVYLFQIHVAAGMGEMGVGV